MRFLISKGLLMERIQCRRSVLKKELLVASQVTLFAAFSFWNVNANWVVREVLQVKCLCPRFTSWSPDPGCLGIWRWVLWRWLGLGLGLGQALSKKLQERISALMKGRGRDHSPVLSRAGSKERPCEHRTQERTLPRNLTKLGSYLALSSSRAMKKKCLLFKPPGLW